MNKPRPAAGRSAPATATSQAISDRLQRALSPASASWATYTSRLQEETIHFTGTWLGRCMEMTDRFARCRSFADVVDAQAQFIGDLLSDFIDEGAMFASALCGPALEPFAASAKKRGAT